MGHSIWDLHFSIYAQEVYFGSFIFYGSISVISGLYNYLLTVGIKLDYQIYMFIFYLLVLSFLLISLGRLHFVFIDRFIVDFFYVLSIFSIIINRILLVFESRSLRFNYHFGSLLGLTSILWSGHIIHIALPASRGFLLNYIFVFSTKFVSISLFNLFNFNWFSFNRLFDTINHIIGSFIALGSSILTFIGGLENINCSLYLSDIAHHHLALGILLIWTANLYKSLYKGLGHKISNIIKINALFNLQFAGALKFVKFILISFHLQLFFVLSSFGVITSVVAQHMYSMNSYLYLFIDYVSTSVFYIHHQYIASRLMLGSFIHVSLFLVRDYYKNL